MHEALVEGLRVPANDPTVWLRQGMSAARRADRHGESMVLAEVTMFSGRSDGTRRRHAMCHRRQLIICTS